MQELAEKTGKLLLDDFLDSTFVLPLLKKRPELRKISGWITGSIHNAILEVVTGSKQEWTTFTVSNFLESYSKKDVAKFPNIGKAKLKALAEYLAIFGLQLKDDEPTWTGRTLSDDAKAVLGLIK